jgi:Pyruvate/2-oxoacid:ferredoxin oxidoreductase gamma subunit
MWLKVGTLASGVEEKIDGYVWQANTKAVKAAWLSVVQWFGYLTIPDFKMST